MMLDRISARRFAEEWIAAWNSHDLERILAHYSDDFEMATPFIAKLMNEPSGRLRGKDAVGAYWTKALARMPDLRFELIEVLVGADSLCIYYDSVLGLRAVEYLSFGPDGKISRAAAHYNNLGSLA